VTSALKTYETKTEDGGARSGRAAAMTGGNGKRSSPDRARSTLRGGATMIEDTGAIT